MDFRITEKGLAALAGNDDMAPEQKAEEAAEELARAKEAMLTKLINDFMRGMRDFTHNQAMIAQYGYQNFTGDEVLAAQTIALFKTSMVWIEHLSDGRAMAMLEVLQEDISLFIDRRRNQSQSSS